MPLIQKPVTLSPTAVENVQDTVAAMLTQGTNVTLSYNDATGALTVNASGGGGSSPLPYHVNIPSTITPSAASGATTFAYQGAAIYNAAIHAGVSVNNYMEWDFVVAAGTYSLRVIYVKAVNEGISTLSIDGVDLGTTIDMYGTFAANAVQDYTGIALTEGRHQIRFRCLTKNASSSNYVQLIQGFAFTRTGA